MRILGLLVFFLAHLPSTEGLAAQVDPKGFSARVQVVVEADSSIKSEVISYVNRELRSLGDVVNTDEKPQYTLRIIAMEEKTVRGDRTGVALSLVVTSPFDAQAFKEALCGFGTCGKFPQLETILVSQMGSVYVAIRREQLLTGSNLKRMCESIVADFDTGLLEEDRKLWTLVNSNQ